MDVLPPLPLVDVCPPDRRCDMNSATKPLTPRQLFDLSGKVALVTGGARGLGFEIARALGAAGALVALNGRTHDSLNQARDRLRGEGLKVEIFAGDVGDDADGL